MDSALLKSTYLSLVTFRKDGREVPTPVWFVEMDGKLYAYTLAGMAKLKRLNNSPRIKVAPCDMRGRVLGAWSEGTGRVITDPLLVARAYGAFTARFGWMYRISTLLSWLSGKYPRRVMMELTV